MYKKNANVLGKIVIILSLLALSLIPAVALARPGFVIDGSTTVYPIASVAQFQHPSAPWTIYYTGSGHGQVSIMNDFPTGINVDLALSSSSCSTSNQNIPVPDEFTAGEYTPGAANTSDWRCPGQPAGPLGNIVGTTVAKDALAVIKNNARVSSKPGCVDFFTRNMLRAIWQGYAYDPAADTATRVWRKAVGAPETGGQCGNLVDDDGDGVADDGCPIAHPGFYIPVRHTWAEIWPACASTPAEPWANDTIVPVARIHESGTRDSFNSLNSFQRNASFPTSPAPFGKNAIYTDELLSLDPAGTLPAGGADPNGYAYACTTGGLSCPGGYNPPLFGTAARQQGNSQTNALIAANANYLGYSSLAFTVGVTTINARCGGNSYTNCGSQTTVAPTKANVVNSTYPLRRDLFMFTNSLSNPQAIQFAHTDMLTGRYQSIVANVGYVEVIPFNTNPPNWDLDLGGGPSGSLGISDAFDVSVLGGDWNRTCPADPEDDENPTVRGCTRADINFDTQVNGLDVGGLGGCWNKVWGPSVANTPGCWDNVSGYPR
jgi:ABC-type phosphate transport system substrate-binding protein